jgi:hypothetical protein
MTYQLHPLCTLFPRMSGAEFDALRDDIKANGLRSPIVLHDGMILDGGNRYRACVEAGIDPAFAEFDGGNLVSFVLSANLHRRHMKEGQVAAIVASAQNWAEAQKPGRPQKQGTSSPISTLADRMAASGASEKTQKRADKLVRENPALAKQVTQGTKSLYRAVKEVSIAKPAAARAQEAPAELEVDDMPTLEEIVDEQTREIAAMDAQIKALAADDTRAELVKQIAIRQGIEARLSDEMEKNKQLDKQLSIFGKWYAELRKITGLDQRSEITRFVREATQARESAL